MDIKRSTAIKGAAIILVLLHHLFFTDASWGIWYQASVAAKVGLAVFVLMSGWGLAESWKRSEPTLRAFYRRRLARLYGVYWPVWLVFVPLNMLITGRSIQQVYGVRDLVQHVGLEFLGLQSLLGFSGWTNPTWWFMTLILLLYAVFPLLHKVIIRTGAAVPLALIAVGLLEPHLDAVIAPVTIDWLWPYLAAFAVGVWLSVKFDVAAALSKVRRHPVTSAVLATLAALLILFLRMKLGVRLPALFPLPVIVLTWLICERVPMSERTLRAFGVVSFEIFLTHTFLYSSWFRGFYYGLGSPWLTFPSLAVTAFGLGALIHYTLERARTVSLDLARRREMSPSWDS